MVKKAGFRKITQPPDRVAIEAIFSQILFLPCCVSQQLTQPILFSECSGIQAMHCSDVFIINTLLRNYE